MPCNLNVIKLRSLSRLFPHLYLDNSGYGWNAATVVFGDQSLGNGISTFATMYSVCSADMQLTNMVVWSLSAHRNSPILPQQCIHISYKPPMTQNLPRLLDLSDDRRC